MNMDFIKKHKYKILYFIALGATLFTWFRMHTFMISIVPWGVHLDEAALGYNAYCIANYGVDRYLNHMPVYIANFEGGQSAMYTYLVAILIKFMGTSTTVLRIPAFIFAIITMVCGFLIIQRKYGKYWALFGTFLIAVLPVFTQQARIGLDCNLMLGSATLATWVFILALNTSNDAESGNKRYKIWLYALDGFLWAMVLYTYALSYVIVPIFLGVMVIYLLCIKKIDFKSVLVAGAVFILFAWPLLVMVIINKFGLDPVVTPFFTIPRLGTDRGAELTLHNFWGNFVSMMQTIFYYDEMDYNALIGFRTMYYFSVPFVALGAMKCVYDSVVAIKHKTCDISLVMLIYCISQLLVGSMRPNTNINNMNAVYFSFLYFIVVAVKFLLDVLNLFVLKMTSSKVIAKAVSCVAISIIIICYLVKFSAFSDYYFYHHSRIDYPMFLFNGRLDDIVAEYGEDFGGKTTYIDAYHIYYLLATKKSPYDIDLTNGMSEYGNIHFVDEYHAMPDFIDTEAIYIVQETNEEYMEFLRDSFENESWSGFYHIFRN